MTGRGKAGAVRRTANAGGSGSWRTLGQRLADADPDMVAGQGIAVAGGDLRFDAGQCEQRHAGGDVAVMMMAAGMPGMLVGMMIVIVQRDIAEHHMLMIARRAGHVLDVVDHAGGTCTREYQCQRDAKRRADLAERVKDWRVHAWKLA